MAYDIEIQCDMGQDFFIWIRRNPLKSPDSAKGIQGNPSFFPWIYLHLLALIERDSAASRPRPWPQDRHCG